MHIYILTNDHCPANLTGKAGVIAEPWINPHDRIQPTSKQSSKSKICGPTSIPNAAGKMEKLESLTSVPNQRKDKDINLNIPPEHSSKLSTGIDKNSILSEYQASCMKKGILSEVSTVTKVRIHHHHLSSTLCIIASSRSAR